MHYFLKCETKVNVIICIIGTFFAYVYSYLKMLFSIHIYIDIYSCINLFKSLQIIHIYVVLCLVLLTKELTRCYAYLQCHITHIVI